MAAPPDVHPISLYGTAEWVLILTLPVLGVHWLRDRAAARREARRLRRQRSCVPPPRHSHVKVHQ